MRDEDYGAALTLAEGDDGIWSPPMAASACEQPDWRSLYEQAHTRAEKERARADAAQARAEELRRAEVDSRARAGSLKWQLDTCRNKLKAASEETKEVRRAAKDALFFQAEVARLETLLSQAGVESSKRSTIMSLRMEVARLGKAVKASQARAESLEGQLARLRATGSVLSKALYGRKSEQQEKPRSGRKRGQQRGAAGHGRTQRPGLEERTEEHNPPADARVCSCCAKPYVANGERSSTVIEIEVKAHTRRIVRPRWRRNCDCASSPLEVSAPPVPRLFPNTPYGISFWARFLFEHCACFRPLHRVGAWLCAQGLSVSPGTLANTLKRFVALFEPVAEAILAHQNEAALRHADETTWRVQALREEGRSSRAWLWTSVSNDAVYFHIDPSRSAEAAHKLFAEAVLDTVIVCDRYSAYKRLARLLGGLVTLAWCWSHQRRDFIECAAGQVSLTQWCGGWIERIASIYRLNDARLEHYDPGLKRQTPEFDAAQGALNEALDALFAHAERELAGLADQAREGKALRSLVNHRDGLSVFVDRPQVPMDNNLAERVLRGPVIGRRLSFGSDSETGARFTAVMYSVIATLSLNGIDVLRWLEAWLTACAHNGGRPADDLSPWLPWSMRRGPQAQLHDAAMTGAVECRYYGRDFTAEEMALLRALIAVDPHPTRAALSREFCRRIGWFKPDGGLKDMMARVTMLAMHRDGLIVLPPPKGRQYRPKPIVLGHDTEPPLFPAPTTLDDVRPLALRTVVRDTREGKRWNEFIARYHYLGYKTLVGAQMRYAVHDRNGWALAMLGFSTAAWKLAPRDHFIGWTPPLREKNLPLVVDNPRFLILPWINIHNLGSHILAIVRRRLPQDWTERYHTTPVLIETFVETPRYTGAVYRASGWTHVGATQGRGRYDRHTKRSQPRKDIWLRPLRKDWKRTLNR